MFLCLSVSLLASCDYNKAMAHSHSHHEHAHGHSHHHHHGDGSSIGIAFFLNLSFTLIELVGGLMTNSLAILSDAVHDLGDSVALALTWYFEKLSHRSRDQTYTYGYRRWSVAAAVISSFILLLGSVLIVKEAIPRLWAPEPVQVPGMLGLACLGLLVNGLAVLRLKDSDSPGEKAAYLHLLEDVLGWLAVLIGSVVLLFTNWIWIDPLLSLGVSVFILRNVLLNLRSFSRILLQAVPEGCNPDELQQQIESLPGVQAVHDLHIWTLDSNRHVLSLHLVVAAQTPRDELLKIKYAAKELIRQAGITHDTLEIEFADEACQVECS